jgi:hypothetical protein
MLDCNYCEPNNVVDDYRDFTTEKYQELIRLAVKKRNIVDYSTITWEKEFLLWRHDIDISLNRALVLAKIEHAEGLKATYFINPHSELYNLAELSQYQLIKQILGLGHDLGLHFDCAFYNLNAKSDLDQLVKNEAAYLNDLFDVMPTAFSFHNPTDEHLLFNNDQYGGLENCYSKKFRTLVDYCSDSNGYWRHRRLQDVLVDGKNDRLQVLTHPGWWQDKPMSPRKRRFRSVYGRAAATMSLYDNNLVKFGRKNLAGLSSHLKAIQFLDSDRVGLLDYLWNSEYFQTLYIELWRLHKEQLRDHSIEFLGNNLIVHDETLGELFNTPRTCLNEWLLFENVFNTTRNEVLGSSAAHIQECEDLYHQLLESRPTQSNDKIEKLCVEVCHIILQVNDWIKTTSSRNSPNS